MSRLGHYIYCFRAVGSKNIDCDVTNVTKRVQKSSKNILNTWLKGGLLKKINPTSSQNSPVGRLKFFSFIPHIIVKRQYSYLVKLLVSTFISFCRGSRGCFRRLESQSVFCSGDLWRSSVIYISSILGRTLTNLGFSQKKRELSAGVPGSLLYMALCTMLVDGKS